VSQLSKNWISGVAMTVFAGLLMNAAPAFAQTSDESEPVTVAEDATEGDRATQPCACPCGLVSEANEETRVIYVGPRQNIPMKVKRKKSEEKSGNDQEALEPQS